jgi:ubiquitin fusion degradation protein 1
LIELNQLDAMSYGVLLFEIKAVSSNVSIIKFTDTVRKVTHCGVREFSASPGTVGIPSKVLQSLEIDVKSMSDISICVKYVRLPKITYVKFEPKMNEFFAVGPVKLCLEENLRQHSTMTVGDLVTVWYKGKSHILSVVDMKPEAMGTLIDTDVEVDLDLSAEYKKMQERTVNIPLTSGIDDSISKLNTGTGNRLGSSVQTYNDNNDNNDNNIGSSGSSTKRLIDIPSEPPESEKENTVKIKLRLPNGVGARRFYTAQPLRHLFEYVSSITDLDVNSIQLSAQFPPRTIGINDLDKKFSDIGFHGGQELIHVKRLM